MNSSRLTHSKRILFAAQLCLLLASQTARAESAYERTFPQKFNAIEIENANGRTEVETWNSNRVRVTASRGSVRSDSRSLDSRIRFQVTSNDLRIVVRDERSDGPINLLVFVPRQINLSVRGESDNIAIKGITNAL